MNKSFMLIGFVIFLALILSGSNVFGKKREGQKCCIGGKYSGTHTDFSSRSCPEPETGKFNMEINQNKGCGSNITGKIINPDGTSQDFTGTVTPGRLNCCTLKGVVKKPDEETDFKGTLCTKDGKWSGEGNYTNKRESVICKGKWEMTKEMLLKKVPMTITP